MKIFCYNKPNVKTSGARFWNLLTEEFKKRGLYSEENYDYIYANIWVPFRTLFKNKLKRKKIILRVDGIWAEKITQSVVFLWPKSFKKLFCSFLLTIFGESFFINLIYNCFFRGNYKIFFKIFLADCIIFQSVFAESGYLNYWFLSKFLFKKKKAIIHNGCNYSMKDMVAEAESRDKFNLITIYGDGSKRVDKILEFVQWANKKKKSNLHLHLIGFNGKDPKKFTEKHMSIIAGPYVTTYNKFDSLNEIEAMYKKAKFYLTFSYRDVCPNVLIEAMSFGLPVIGLKSGGVTELLDEKCLVDFDDTEGFFFDCQNGKNLPTIDFEKVYLCIKNNYTNYANIKKLTIKRFQDNFAINQIFNEYLKVALHFNAL